MSSLTGEGHDGLWSAMDKLQQEWTQSGWWSTQRAQQRLDAMERHAKQLLIDAHMHHKSEAWASLRSQVEQENLAPLRRPERGFSSPWIRDVCGNGPCGSACVGLGLCVGTETKPSASPPIFQDFKLK